MIEGLNEVIKADSARSTKVDCTAAVEEYVNKSDWRINANSNTGYSHAGLINNLAGKVIANFWLDKVYSKGEGDAHRNGDYHIHDLDNLAPYCFTGDTKIKVRLERNSDNLERSLEWLSGYNTVFYVCTVDNNGKTVWSRANKCRQTRITNVIKLTFNNDEKNTVRCTPDHKFKLVDGIWVEAKDLTSNMNLLTVSGEEYHVTNIEEIKEPQHVYCLEELDTGTHSFALQNGVVVHNCCGHDLQKLLDEGFNGVIGRVASTPPSHVREALYQMANYIGILQAEWAGAQAFSSFDTYLAPYVFYDMYCNNLEESDVKKAIRNFVYNLNVPSRWGQCVPESYRCLKTDGTWVNYKNLKIGDEIYVVDMETGKLKKDIITHINLFDAPEKMHRYYNDQGFNFSVTKNHRVINHTGSNPWRLTESEELLKYKSPIHIPVSSWSPMTIEEYAGNEYDISDEMLELFAFIITDGHIQKQEGHSLRIDWFKSIKRWGIDRFEEICDILGVGYSKDKRENHGFPGSVGYRYRLHVCEATNKIIELLQGDKQLVPEFIKKLSPRQCNIILDIWSQTDGCDCDGRWKLQADNHNIQEMLAYMAIKVGKAVSIDERIIGTNKKATIYTHLHLRGTRCCKIEEVDAKYEKVWCPTTNTGTFVCMTDEGYVFLTGNSPFSNVTIDWTCPEILRDKIPTRKGDNFFLSVISERMQKDSDFESSEGYKKMSQELKNRLGELASNDDTMNYMGATYSLFQKEMNVINRCFYEILNEGDMNGQPFTFPIPTINITEDFNWYGENTDLLFENAAKYGSSYFQNFIGSQYMIDEHGNKVRDPKAYSPKDLRSMCPLTGDTRLVVKRPELKEMYMVGKGTIKVNEYKDEIVTIQELYDNYEKYKNYGICAISPLGNSSLSALTRFRPNKQQKQKVYSIKLDCNGVEKEIKMGENHLQPVLAPQVINNVFERLFVDMRCSEMKEQFDIGFTIHLPVFEGVNEGAGIGKNLIIQWYKIKSFEEIEYNDDLYCIEILDDLGYDHSIPYFAIENGIITHNCRLSLDLKALRKKGGGLFGSDAQTGSIGVVTINCARLGYLYKGDEKELYKALDKLLNMAKSTLEKKRKVVTEFYDRGLYPYTRRYLPNKYDSFFSTIGVNGMNEMIRNFTNDEHDITDEYGQNIAKKVLLHIREKLTTWQQETGNLYNLEATPAEGTCYRLCSEDKKRYKDIIHAGTDEEPYYTNSSQLPVDFTNDAFEVLDLQDELQKMYTGGTVLHLYMNERISNAEAARQLIKKVLTNYRLPYISITPSFSVCPIHGYIKGHHEFCPKCDRELMNKHAEEIDFNS